MRKRLDTLPEDLCGSLGMGGRPQHPGHRPVSGRYRILFAVSVGLECVVAPPPTLGTCRNFLALLA
jgi:hypothetical protein